MHSRRMRRFYCGDRICCRNKKSFATQKELEQHRKYMRPKILFQSKFVTLCIGKFGIKRLKLRADQLVRHFTHAQIRKAAEKLMKKKIALNF